MSLKERRDIAHLHGHTPRGVLFTLVETHGSTSHAAGARLYAVADGRSAGAVSSGWIEAKLLQRADLFASTDAQMQTVRTAIDMDSFAEAHLLAESSDTSEAAALIEALEATLRGELRSVVTVLPEAGTSLLRFVMDENGDVLFASDLLETEEIVPMRRAARSSSHGALHPLAKGRMFVEHMDPVPEQDMVNNTLHTEAR